MPDKTQLRAYMGLLNYENRFLPNLSAVVWSLNQTLEKERKWRWKEKCEKAFSETKRMLTNYDPAIKLECDASAYGMGAVLSDVMEDGTDRPIGFVSRSVTSAERNYTQIDKEALALIWGVKKFHSYLYGRHFTLAYTIHS